MKVGILSLDGSGLGLGYRLKTENVNVVACLPKLKETKVYDGLLRKVTFSELIDFSPDIVLVDHVGLSDYADRLRSAGFFVFNGYKIGDRLELDREFGIEAFKEAGLKVPESRGFTDPKEAANWLRKQDWDGAVIKPHEESKGIRIMTTVFKDKDDAIKFLVDAPSRGIIPVGEPFVVQRFVNGIEISTEWWMLDGKLMPHSINHTLEEKMTLAGNLGTMSGCSTTVVFMNPLSYSTPFHSEIVGKFYNWLSQRNEKFSGCFDLNSIIDLKGDFYILEACGFRFGYGAIYALLELIPQGTGRSFAEFIEGLIISHQTGSDKADDIMASWGHYPTFGGHLRIFVHPAPLHGLDKNTEKKVIETLFKDFPITVDYDVIYPCRFYPQDLYYDEITGFAIAGEDGVIGELTCGGETIGEIAAALYDAAKGIHGTNIYYRYPDGFDRFEEAIEDLVMKYRYLPDHLL